MKRVCQVSRTYIVHLKALTNIKPVMRRFKTFMFLQVDFLKSSSTLSMARRGCKRIKGYANYTTQMLLLVVGICALGYHFFIRTLRIVSLYTSIGKIGIHLLLACPSSYVLLGGVLQRHSLCAQGQAMSSVALVRLPCECVMFVHECK